MLQYFSTCFLNLNLNFIIFSIYDPNDTNSCSDNVVTCVICVTIKVKGVTMLHKCYMCFTYVTHIMFQYFYSLSYMVKIVLQYVYCLPYVYIGGRDLSIPAYFIPAHVDGAWSKILGCCCSAALDRTAPRDRREGIYKTIDIFYMLYIKLYEYFTTSTNMYTHFIHY